MRLFHVVRFKVFDVVTFFFLFTATTFAFYGFAIQLIIACENLCSKLQCHIRFTIYFKLLNWERLQHKECHLKTICNNTNKFLFCILKYLDLMYKIVKLNVLKIKTFTQIFQIICFFNIFPLTSETRMCKFKNFGNGVWMFTVHS